MPLRLAWLFAIYPYAGRGNVLASVGQGRLRKAVRRDADRSLKKLEVNRRHTAAGLSKARGEYLIFLTLKKLTAGFVEGFLNCLLPRHNLIYSLLRT